MSFVQTESLTKTYRVGDIDVPGPDCKAGTTPGIAQIIASLDGRAQYTTHLIEKKS